MNLGSWNWRITGLILNRKKHLRWSPLQWMSTTVCLSLIIAWLNTLNQSFISMLNHLSSFKTRQTPSCIDLRWRLSGCCSYLVLTRLNFLFTGVQTKPELPPLSDWKHNSGPSLGHCQRSEVKEEVEQCLSHHLSPCVALLLVVEHGRVQRHPPPGPVLAGEHHHGRLHPGHRLGAVLLHMGRGHGVPVGVRVPGLQPAALCCCSQPPWQKDCDCGHHSGPSPAPSVKYCRWWRRWGERGDEGGTRRRSPSLLPGKRLHHCGSVVVLSSARVEK